VQWGIRRKRIGFGENETRELTNLLEQLGRPDEKGRLKATPNEVVRILRIAPTRIVFVFDEFDQLTGASVAKGFTETIKALSDFGSPVKIVIVGVADDVDNLISAHPSVERAMKQIRMPRMEGGELTDFLRKATERLGMTVDEATGRRLVRLAHGLPHYAHLLGLHASRAALNGGTTQIDDKALSAGIEDAIRGAEQSHLDAYMKAVSSNRSDALFKQVLLACALAETDDRFAFTSGALRAPLKAMDHEMEIPAYAQHLKKFTAPERGRVLKRTGGRRQYRYRFTRPLLQPYVVLRGISEGLITPSAAERFLERAADAAR
jgi:hypothetical protein